MKHASRGAGLALVLACAGVAASASPLPTPAATGRALPPPGAAGAATAVTTAAASAAAVPLVVRFAGSVNCDLFPYACFPVLSVLAPNADVPDSWRPAATDPRWVGHETQGTTDLFDPTPVGHPPAALPGLHRLVMTL